MMRTILFDFGGTLDYPRHWLDRFVTHYRAAGIEITRAQLDPAFDHATRMGYRSTRLLSSYGLTELVDFLVHQQLGYLNRDGAPEIRETLGAASAGMRLPEIAGFITQSFVSESRLGLAASRKLLMIVYDRFRMGIVSNFYGNLENILAEYDLASFFAAVADSSQLGVFKPEPGIFDHAIKALGAVPAETSMVGDSLNKDCAPARDLGLTTIWLRHPLPDDGRTAYGSAVAKPKDFGEPLDRRQSRAADQIGERQSKPSRETGERLLPLARQVVEHSGRWAGDEIAETEQTQFVPDFTIDSLAELEHLRWWRS
jgi:FMN phosphatase YigB (HAD superfamily)